MYDLVLNPLFGYTCQISDISTLFKFSTNEYLTTYHYIITVDFITGGRRRYRCD
jgi:hypothetical protein